MRRFELHRDEDESGVSGTGIVAEGVEFTDGSVAMRWRSEHTSTAIYASAADVEAIHGHGGKTRLVWLDRTKPGNTVNGTSGAAVMGTVVFTNHPSMTAVDPIRLQLQRRLDRC